MTSITYCERCDTQQPHDWKAGDLCTSCGGAVREEVRCAWCCQTTPKGKFCKHCGNEIQSDTLFGATRILKSLGVSQLELTQKLASLSEQKVQQYQRQFNEHYAILQQEYGILKRLEHFLAIQGQDKFSLLEKEWLPKIPFGDDFLDKRGVFDPKLYDTDEEFLSNDISQCSPIVQALYPLAKNRTLPYPQDSYQVFSQQIFEGISSSSLGQEERALALGHVHAFHSSFPWPTDHPKSNAGKAFLDTVIPILERLLEHPSLSISSAIALVHILKRYSSTQHPSFDRYRLIAEKGWDSQNLEIRLASAFLFENEDLIVQIAQKEHVLAVTAIQWLLQRDSPKTGLIGNREAINSYQWKGIEDYLKRIVPVTGKERGNMYDVFQFYIKNTKPQSLKTFVPAVFASLSDSRTFEKATKDLDEDGISLAYRKINFIGTFDQFTQKQIDLLSAHYHQYQHQDTESILTYPAQYQIDYTSLRNLYFGQILPFEDFETTFNYLQGWPQRMMQGHYPTQKIVEKLLAFFDVYMVQISLDQNEYVDKRVLMVEILILLSKKENDISRKVFQFVWKQILNENVFFNASWFCKLLKNHGFFQVSHYYTAQEEIPLQVHESFIRDFFKGDWGQFIQAYASMVPIQAPQREVLEDLIVRNPNPFVEVLEEHPLYQAKIVKALKKAIVFDHQGILEINSTTTNAYPLVKYLALSQWDSNDVKLFSYCSQNIPVSLQLLSMNSFCEWLIEKDGRNFYAPHFEKYGKHFFNASKRTLSQVKLWLFMGAPSRKEESIYQFIQETFSSFHLLSYTSAPIQLHRFTDGSTHDLTAQSIHQNLFVGFDPCLQYISQNFKFGLSVPQNKFILHYLYSIRNELGTYFQDDQDKLQEFATGLLNIAYHPSNQEKDQERWLKSVESILIALEGCFEAYHLYLHHLMRLVGLHWSIGEGTADFITESVKNRMFYLPEAMTKLLYEYLEDYYYNNSYEVRWVWKTLEACTEQVAHAFRENGEFMISSSETVFYILNRKKKFDHSLPVEQKRFLDHLEKHYFQVLDIIGQDDLPPVFLEHLLDQLDAEVYAPHLYKRLESWLNDRELLGQFEEEIASLIAPQDSPSLPNEQMVNQHNSSANHSQNTEYIGDAIELESMTMSIEDISVFMASFQVDQPNMDQLINHLQYYKKDHSNNPILLSILMMKQGEIKTYLAQELETAISLYQKLLEICLEPQCAPDGLFSSYGQLACLQFQQLLEGSMMQSQYAVAVESMLQVPHYTESHKQMLTQLLAQLKN